MDMTTIGMITASTSVVVVGGYGLLYLYDDNLAKTLLFNLSWEATKQYHKIKHNYNYYYYYLKGAVDAFEEEYLKDIRKQTYEDNEYNVLPSDDSEGETDEVDEIDKKDNKHKNTPNNDGKEDYFFLGYNLIDDTTKRADDLKDNYVLNNNFDVLFVSKLVGQDNEECFVRITNDEKETMDQIQFISIPKQFMQIVLFQGGKKYEIQEHIHNFYFHKNVILDDKFLVWYLKYYYGLELLEEYYLQIIDTNVNLFKLNQNQKIKFVENTLLVETKNEPEYSYEIITTD